MAEAGQKKNSDKKNRKRCGDKQQGFRQAHQPCREGAAGGAGAETSGVFIVCGEYGFASMVAFYTPRQLPTHLWPGGGVHGMMDLRPGICIFQVQTRSHAL